MIDVLSFILGFVFGALITGALAGFILKMIEDELKHVPNVRQQDEHAQGLDDDRTNR